jgi:hypothetical protein
MAAVNRKSAKRLIVTVERQLGRPLTFREFARLLQGDNTVISKKSLKEGTK